jgi:chromosome segregation protein
MKGERSGYVTADGSRLTPEGFILPPPATRDVLEVERERHTLAEELEGARKEREHLAASLARLDEEIGRLGDECGRLERESVALEQEMQAIERQIEDWKARVARLESERLRLENERSSIEAQARQAREQASRAEGDEAQAREERRQAGSAVEEARAELTSLDDTMRSIASRLSTLEAIETEVSSQLASLVKRTAKLEQEIAEAQERRASLTPVLDAREQQRARIQRVFAACSGLEETISRRIREITLSRSGEFERFEAYRREVARIMKESGELSNQKEKLLTRKQVIATQMVEVETRVRLKTEEMFESTGYTIERAVSEIDVAGKDRELVRREYERLKREFEAVGEYNPLAERDYERLKARSDYYARHIADLESAAQNLRVIIEEVDRRMVATFTDAFERVRSEFKQMFVRMFGGGNADMVLENADDPLESTIRITAQPPGKKLRRISLLSGGEKSLVSLAVVFALTRVFKVPFLVLDEVEPALDDLNLSRLIDILREIARETQVIIITHQARTIEAASVVYGVTMGKDGVSSVYGQRFSEQTGALASTSELAGA